MDPWIERGNFIRPRRCVRGADMPVSSGDLALALSAYCSFQLSLYLSLSTQQTPATVDCAVSSDELISLASRHTARLPR